MLYAAADEGYCNTAYINNYDGWAQGQEWDLTFGVASPDYNTIYDELDDAEFAAGAFYFADTLTDLIACSDGQCTAVHTEMNSGDFEILFSKSTAYATGITIDADSPAYPATIGNWVSVTYNEGYLFNEWWNPTSYSGVAYENVSYVLGNAATFTMLMSTTSLKRYEVGDTSTFWIMVNGPSASIRADHKSTAVTWAGSEKLQASTAAAIIALTYCLF